MRRVKTKFNVFQCKPKGSTTNNLNLASLFNYKEEKVFPFSGEYTFNVRQAMRKNGFSEGLKVLEGVTDVGFSIEKTK